MRTEISPVTATGRIHMLDVLRGLAIFGILIVNMQIFYHPITSMLMGSQSEGQTLSVLSESFIKFFFEGKFYVLFSLLFGYGFWLFINKTIPEGSSIVPVYLRRVVILLLFGIMHIVLLWAGDILVFYALFGMVLLLFRKVSDRGLIKWAIWLGIIPSLLSILMTLLFVAASSIPEAREAAMAGVGESMLALQTLYQEAYETYSTGTFGEIVIIRLKEYRQLLAGLIFFYPVVMAMFLLGTYFARKGYVKNYEHHLPIFRKILWWGIPIGLISNSIYTYGYQHANPMMPGLLTVLSSITHTLGGISFALVYASAIILLTSRSRLKAFSQLLAPVGRMALTNYLLQSIICTSLFLSYGFGLFGKLTGWQGILLAIVIFALQILFSKYWLRCFHYGPFEWLWRSLTYMKWQAFRRQG